MDITAKIEAILFWKAEPVETAWLAKTISVTEDEIKNGLSELEKKLQGRGVALVFKDNEVSFRTAPEMTALIERLTKEELSRDLGKAGLETIAIVPYQGPISRREIDYIRGVNSAFILRALLIRGLLEKVENPKDKRSFLYRPTFDMLSYLGVSRIEDLPQYQEARKEIENFMAAPPEDSTVANPAVNRDPFSETHVA